MNRKNAFIVLVSLLLFLVYLNHFNNGFHFDDSHTVVDNSAITKISNIPNFFADSQTFSVLPSNQSYRPFLTTTFAIDYFIGGKLNPIVFHITSYIVFCLQLIAMYILFTKILDIFYPNNKWNKYISCFSCIWYGFHGAIAETVNYVSARSDMLSTLFLLIAVNMFISKNKYKQLYFIPLLLGLFSKEATLVFPMLIFCYEYLRINNQISLNSLLQTFKKVLPSLIFCICFFISTKIMAPQWVSGGVSRWQYLITQPYIVLDYFLTFLYPTGLVADTDWVVFKTVFNIKTFLGILFIALMLYLAKINLKENKGITFGILWFLISLLPSSSFIPLAEVKNDHRLYLPYVGLVFAATIYLKQIIIDKINLKVEQKNLILNTFLILIIIPNAMLVFYRNEIWHSGETLWKEVTEKAPKNARGLMNYGLVLMERGDYSGAESYYLSALRLWPYYPTIYVNLGILNSAQSKHEKAEEYFKSALHLKTKDPSAYYYYAKFLYKLRRYPEAKEYLSETIRLSPGFADAHILMKEIEKQA